DIDFGLIRNEYEYLYELLAKHAVNINEDDISCKNRRYLLHNIDRALRGAEGRLLFLRTQTHIKIIKGSRLANARAIDFFPFDYISEKANIEEYKRQAQYLSKKRKSGKS